MKTYIDPDAGFCFGVEKAIEKAEKLVNENDVLFCLGDLVHNPAEMKRLGEMGLITISHHKLDQAKNKKLLFRAHGEPPESYEKAAGLKAEVIDATCPIVRKLQESIRMACSEMEKKNGQVVLFGKVDHPEVKGLLGHAGGNVIVASSFSDLKNIDFSKPVSLFSQTTSDPLVYESMAIAIGKKMSPYFPDHEIPLDTHHTICKRVSRRVPALRKFAKTHQLIIFAGSKTSSNSQLLFEICRRNNPQSHFIEQTGDLRPEWFSGVTTTGITGATSTPVWLLREIETEIRKMTNF